MLTSVYMRIVKDPLCWHPNALLRTECSVTQCSFSASYVLSRQCPGTCESVRCPASELTFLGIETSLVAPQSGLGGPHLSPSLSLLHEGLRWPQHDASVILKQPQDPSSNQILPPPPPPNPEHRCCSPGSLRFPAPCFPPRALPAGTCWWGKGHDIKAPGRTTKGPGRNVLGLGLSPFLLPPPPPVPLAVAVVPGGPPEARKQSPW